MRVSWTELWFICKLLSHNVLWQSVRIKSLHDFHVLAGKITEGDKTQERNLTDNSYKACRFQGDSVGYNDEFPDDADRTRSRMSACWIPFLPQSFSSIWFGDFGTRFWFEFLSVWEILKAPFDEKWLSICSCEIHSPVLWLVSSWRPFVYASSMDLVPVFALVGCPHVVALR